MKDHVILSGNDYGRLEDDLPDSENLLSSDISSVTGLSGVGSGIQQNISIPEFENISDLNTAMNQAQLSVSPLAIWKLIVFCLLFLIICVSFLSFFHVTCESSFYSFINDRLIMDDPSEDRAAANDSQPLSLPDFNSTCPEVFIESSHVVSFSDEMTNNFMEDSPLTSNHPVVFVLVLLGVFQALSVVVDSVGWVLAKLEVLAVLKNETEGLSSIIIVHNVL